MLKSLETYLFPDLGALPVAEIEPMALLEVLRRIERTGKLDTAKRLHERTQAVFRRYRLSLSNLGRPWHCNNSPAS